MNNNQYTKEYFNFGIRHFNENNLQTFFHQIMQMISNQIDLLTNLQNEIDKKENNKMKMIMNQNPALNLIVNEESKFNFEELNNINCKDFMKKDDNQDPLYLFSQYKGTNDVSNKINLNSIFDLNNDCEDKRKFNFILHYIFYSQALKPDNFLLNQNLIQTKFFIDCLQRSMENFIKIFGKLNLIFMKEILFPLNFDEHSLNNILDNFFNNKELKNNFNYLNSKRPQFDESQFKNEILLNTKRKRTCSVIEENIKNKALHYRPKREYELKKKRLTKLKIFKIEKLCKNNKMILKKGSRKYILKRIQYCWKSYFVKLILKIIPPRYDVIISKKFYQDHTKGFYLQLFNRLNTVRDLIADVISLKKRHKLNKRKTLNIKNMGEFIKEIEITPEKKAFNYKLLDKLNMKLLNLTIKMNMINYFRSKNYKKRIEVYNCKKYDEVDLIKFKKPIKYFYSFIFKDLKFKYEPKKSIFFVNNMNKKT